MLAIPLTAFPTKVMIVFSNIPFPPEILESIVALTVGVT